MSKKPKFIGVIAEDDSDVESVRIFISNITGTNYGIKKFVGKGCGKLKKKCSAWATQLKQKGCFVLIFLHDLDSGNLQALRQKIEESLEPCPIATYLICIPVQELEAWFLSDPAGIKKAMNLKRIPKIKAQPENINSPKEYLEEVIYKASDGERIYVNTKHNSKLSEHVAIGEMRKRCPSFVPFHDFVKKNIA